MKYLVKIGIIVIIIASLCSCTSNQRAKHWGGNMTINIEPGYKVTMATFKGNSLWYMVEPMDDDYVPKDKILIEDSNWGMIEGKVTLHESRANNPTETITANRIK